MSKSKQCRRQRFIRLYCQNCGPSWHNKLESHGPLGLGVKVSARCLVCGRGAMFCVTQHTLDAAWQDPCQCGLPIGHIGPHLKGA
jgi:hypothetical protein